MEPANHKPPRRKRQRFRIAIASLLVTVGLIAILGLLKNMGHQAEQQAAMAQALSQTKYNYSQISQRIFGEGARAYWVYQPEGAATSSAPVVLFLHGWMGYQPYLYGGWIDYLARNGFIVIFPVYQTGKNDTTDQMLQNTILATQNAVNQLNTSNSIRPDWNRFAIVGHSFGGGLSVQIAGRAAESNIPIPKAVMPVAPGWRGSSTIPTDALKKIPASTLILVVEGADDDLKGSRQGKTIYSSTPQIPGDRKGFVLLSSNNPNLRVDHSSPLSPLDRYQDQRLSERERRRQRFNIALFNKVAGIRDGTIDVIDSKGYWLLFDQLCQTAFSGQQSVSNLLQSLSQNFVRSSGTGTPDNPKEFMIGS